MQKYKYLFIPFLQLFWNEKIESIYKNIKKLNKFMVW